jgi:hypothetical protein
MACSDPLCVLCNPAGRCNSSDVRRLVKEAESPEAARVRIEQVEDANEERRLIEKALKSIARLGRRKVALRRFVLAFRHARGTDIKTIAGVESGDGGTVLLAVDLEPVFGSRFKNMDALRKEAMASGYYVAVSYVDKEE